MNEEIYEGTPSQEDVLIGMDSSSYNRYRRPDGSTYVHYPYSLMATVTAYSAKDRNGQPIRTAEGNLIAGNTQAEADRKRFRYDLNHWVEANKRKTAHLPEGWRERIVTPDLNTFNAITGGTFNLTPIQVGRGIYNLSQGKDPEFILGNSGIVSEEYAQEHPWLALGANVLGEGLTGGFIYGAPKLYNASVKNIRNYRTAKAFDNIVKSEIKRKDLFNKNFPLYTYKPEPYNNKLGLPESDPNTFYHYINYPSLGNINGEGVVRFSNFTIKPKYNGSDERIWWDKGNVPRGNDVILSSKSKYIDEHVLSHPEKYSPYRGNYLDSYYTSGDVPINEVNIYTKNPFTGYYDGPHNTITYNPIKLIASKTYLRLFERPSKLTEAERLGIPKGDRGNLTQALQQAIEDFALYRTSGQYRQTLKFTPDGTDYRWTYANAEGPTFLKYFTDLGGVLRGTWGRMPTPDLTGILSYHINKNAAGYSANFPKPEGLGYPVGEANMFLNGNNQKLILTAPRTDFFAGPVEGEEALQAIGNSLSNTIDKEIMRNFWINARKALRPGTYLSGDNGAPPLGSLLIQAYNSKKLHIHPYYERPIKKLLVIRDGLSPDSYSSIIRLGTRDGSLRWGEGFTRWNNSAILNSHIYEAYKDLMSGKITFDQYEKIFNGWSLNLGGKPLQYIIRGGIKRPVHPHPYIYSRKLGGKIK